ncbi:MAG: alpha/beta hydrolase [Muribaculaceae bacterium]|nr:alpha/beta hydrolase [Muribaculaceae bacterium]
MKRITLSLLTTLFCAAVYGQQPVSHENQNQDNAVVYNKADSACLVGTWLVPENRSPKAAIVLATGSGQQDRDETILNHRPFRVLAEKLSNEGYAVLRLDDRGVGNSTGDIANATTATFTSDIASALEWMDSVAPGVKKGVLGHSEGGLIAINLAQNPLCDFIITLAAPAFPGDSIILSQGRAVSVAMLGRYDAEPLQKELLATAKSDLPYEEAKEKITGLMNEQLGAQANIPMVKKQVELQVETVLTPWFREFLRADPTSAISAVNKRWLALNGEKDFQVLPNNLTRIADLNYNAECVLLPSHNHLFLECTSGLPQEYSMLQGDISNETLKTITDWLNGMFQ